MRSSDRRNWFPIILILAILVLGVSGILVARHQKLSQQDLTGAVSTPAPTVQAEGTEGGAVSQPTAEPQSSGQESGGQPEKGSVVQPATTPPAPSRQQDQPQPDQPQPPAQTTPAEQPNPPQETAQPPVDEQKTAQVTLSIRVPDEGRAILSPVQVELEEGDTVLSVLLRATRARGIPMEYSGGKKTAYVEGIDNLYEFSKGPGSGWLYTVNGAFMGRSCGSVAVKENDRIEWVYTLNLGKDVGSGV